MNTKTFLVIATLAGLASTASAASNQPATDVVILPTYVVTAPRYVPAEQKINTQLKEFSRQAFMPKAVTPDLSLLRAHAMKPALVTRVAVTKPLGKS